MDNCAACTFWKKPKELNSATGECHRYAPSPIGAIYKPNDVEATLERGARWPYTEEEDWCGEWKSGPNPTLTTAELKRMKESMHPNK
jgi:hypothetical protein